MWSGVGALPHKGSETQRINPQVTAIHCGKLDFWTLTVSFGTLMHHFDPIKRHFKPNRTHKRRKTAENEPK